MISSLSLPENCCCCSAKRIKKKAKQFSPYKLQVKGSSIISSNESLVNRRLAIFCSGASLFSSITANYNLTALPAKAEEKNPEDKEAEGDAGVIGAIKSFLDPNEKTKSGKVLPKAYLKAARAVVKTLRESLEEGTKDVAKFRRNADAAKESIREYLSGWRGQQAVVAEESYAALEKAIRSLANFYSNAGPFATPSDEVKASILNDLETAEASL
ncbi:photosystem II D1 precursor processing protein PSB27-H2, chloroplastic [Elaeis guineensis]|uniref:Photosystem II D1 precursor processing protein PSB27-H2, chloroplastic n=1 Tax=Elaeis guineensis var. tenera TaxID=51953 RepID=A0A6I9QZ28_ELAGV|nr:photosystem II D1 precursor processing protein PSB27-H2, chloroplastic [Elaeis guineensis]XP_010917725.1 photosystem II D1 precursor processing protein PSB27-H2, chloroplastic [Elaeis guineensis]XP_029119558.1 photosystem II D1 precursor processing protein PSB27-H2, chloroplastic [Elaeis guineensis]